MHGLAGTIRDNRQIAGIFATTRDQSRIPYSCRSLSRPVDLLHRTRSGALFLTQSRLHLARGPAFEPDEQNLPFRSAQVNRHQQNRFEEANCSMGLVTVPKEIVTTKSFRTVNQNTRAEPR